MSTVTVTSIYFAQIPNLNSFPKSISIFDLQLPTIFIQFSFPIRCYRRCPSFHLTRRIWIHRKEERTISVRNIIKWASEWTTTHPLKHIEDIEHLQVNLFQSTIRSNSIFKADPITGRPIQYSSSAFRFNSPSIFHSIIFAPIFTCILVSSLIS